MEFEKPPSSIPHTDLRKESTVKKLIKQGRTPFLLVSDGQEHFERAICFIPSSKSQPAEEFELSIEDAGKIAAVRDRLQKLI